MKTPCWLNFGGGAWGVVSQIPIQIQYKGQLVGNYVVDIVVEDQVILELKAVNQLQTIHEAQLLNYFKATV